MYNTRILCTAQGTGEYCLSVVRLNRGGFRSLTRLRRADFSSSGSAPSRVELLALNEPDEAAEEAAGGLPFHLLILDSKARVISSYSRFF